MYLIDVAIPNYNYGCYLLECVESIISQNFSGMRILILDNGSTDNSRQIIEEIISRYPFIETRLRDQNQGMHSSFNECIDWASSEYFTILHADDVLAPGSLQRAVSFLSKHPDVVMCYGRTRHIGDEGITDNRQCEWDIEPGRQFVLKRFSTAHNTVSCAGVVLRTSAQKNAGHYDQRLRMTSDLEMWLRLARVGSVARATFCQGFVRVHPSNDSVFARDRLAPELDELRSAFEIFLSKQLPGPETDELTYLYKRALIERAYWAALAHFARGSFRAAGELIRMVARDKPTYFLLPPIRYLNRRQDGLKRIPEVLLDALRRVI